MTHLKSFLIQEDGASLAEYGILVALIAAVAIAGVQLLGTSIADVFTQISGLIKVS